MVFLGILFSSQRGERKILDASQGGGGGKKLKTCLLDLRYFGIIR